MNWGRLFTKKKIIWTVIIVVVIGLIVMRVRAGKNNAANIQTDTVKRQDIKQTVLATGQVVSQTDLDLSFKTSGIVQRVYVKEGDKVKAGQVLAALSQSDQLASLTQAQGALAQAQASYEKVLAGASSQDIAVAQAAVDAAKINLANVQSQQQVLVDNAYSALLNSTFAAVAKTNNISTLTPTISGSYSNSDQGNYVITLYSTGVGWHFTLSGLETGDGVVSTIAPVPLGTRGLYIQFPTGNLYVGDTWTISIPNAKASNYLTNYNAYQAALQTQKTAVDTAQTGLTQAQAALALKQAQARPADVDAAKAQILTAQGQVQAAQSALENTMVRAPADGTITSVDIKVGEQATALKEVVVLQDVNNLHIEANVSEANIAQISANQSVDVTFDALGPDRHFTATVQTVNPASTVVSGVVNYLVKASLPDIPDIKPGMTANMTILVGQKSGVLVVPQRAVLVNGAKHVRVIDDPKKKTYHEVEVQTGMEADGGLIEITSGLSEGQEIVTFIKQ
ncbi:MAG: efflux RND transporter periplasmic adaptor subunit [Patescibacteria group bacterium]|nr:efflux RND transporter periplasmic adaptor subunit [Patescibacteria group bacterium]